MQSRALITGKFNSKSWNQSHHAVGEYFTFRRTNCSTTTENIQIDFYTHLHQPIEYNGWIMEMFDWSVQHTQKYTKKTWFAFGWLLFRYNLAKYLQFDAKNLISNRTFLYLYSARYNSSILFPLNFITCSPIAYAKWVFHTGYINI